VISQANRPVGSDPVHRGSRGKCGVAGVTSWPVGDGEQRLRQCLVIVYVSLSSAWMAAG
jgi:hypothetical protein